MTRAPRWRPAATGPTLVLAALLAAGGCYGPHAATLRDAQAAWRGGDRARGLDLARSEYARFRDANDLSEAEVLEAVRGALHQLDEEPVFARGDTPPDTPGDPSTHRGALAAALQRDLLSDRVTAVIRGALVVRDLELRQHAPALLDVVMSYRVLQADGGVLADAPTPLRAVAAKRVALDALEALR